MKTVGKIILLSTMVASNCFGHEGHDEAPGETASAPSSLTLQDSVIKNLGILTEKATLAPFGKTLEMNATIDYVPENYATIASKANGSVRSIFVKLGEKVKKGQKLVSFMPVFTGSQEVTLYSPISGIVAKQSSKIGQPITPETLLMEIADTTKVLAKGITYSEQDIAQIKVGQKAYVQTEGKKETLSGVVQKLDQELNKENRTFSVYALIENPRHILFANTMVTLSLSQGEVQEVLTIPAKAVLGELGEYFVFVREGNNFERREVTIGQKTVNRVEIIEGVLPDEEVVIQGNYQLQYAKPSNDHNVEKK